MAKRTILALLTSLFLIVTTADLTAQAFFPAKVKGTFQVRFTSNAAGVQVAIDGQPAGQMPLTIWVVPGVHMFSFTAPGEETKTVAYPVKGDTEVPFMVTQRNFPLTVNTNVAGATLAIDGVIFPGNSTLVATGSHTLSVSAPGYQSVALPFQQPASANTINVTLVGLQATVTLATDKLFRPGTPYKVFVNNAETRGPILNLTPGSYQIRILSGTFSVETTLTVAAGQALTLEPNVVWQVR